MKRARSGIEILIDRACGVPVEPGASEKEQLRLFARSIAIDTADFMLAFFDAPKAKVHVARLAAVDFIDTMVWSKMEKDGAA